MKRLLLMISLILPSFAVFSQGINYNTGGTSTKNYYQEIPYESINGKMIIEVKVAGKNCRFLFDTGAPTSISKELALASGSKSLQMVLISDPYGHQDSILTVLAKSIQIGDLEFNNITSTTLIPEFMKCWNLSGIIGSNLLRNSIVRIDASKKIITLTDQADRLNLSKKHSSPLALNKNQSDPGIIADLGRRVSVALAFDTGDSGFLSLSEDFMNQLNKTTVVDLLCKGNGSSGLGAFGNEKQTEKYLIRFATFDIGKAKFKNIITQTTKNGISTIGTKLLDHGLVTLDYIHKKFYFEPKLEVNDLNEKKWPFELSVDGNKLIIGVVWDKNSPQIKQGQQIIAINDVSYQDINLCVILNKPNVFTGMETAILTLKEADGSLRKIEFKKEYL